MNETVKPEADETSQTTPEATSEQDDVSILNEWDDTPEETKPAQPPASTTVDPMIAELHYRAQQEDISKAVNAVYDGLTDLPARPNHSAIRYWLEGMAQENRVVSSAWTDRYKNPERWNKVVESLPAEYKKQIEISEPTTTDADREAAVAFVRGSSTQEVPQKPMTNADISNMSDKEFQEFQRKEFGI